MVKIINGYSEREKIKKRYDTIYNFAKDIFKSAKLSHDCAYYNNIHLYPGLGGEIYCGSNLIEVKDENLFKDCLNLAERCEKELKEEWKIETKYKIGYKESLKTKL